MLGTRSPRVLDSLGALVRDRPGTQAQIEELDRLAHAKFDELGETIALARAGNHERALAILNSDRGKHILDETRERAATVKSSEMARAARFYATAERYSWFSFAASALATASIIVAVLMLLATARRIQRRQDLRIVDLQNFAGRVAHDIRSPLATVSLGIDVARRHLGEKERAVPALDRAAATLRRVSALVEGLLTFAQAGQRPEQGAEADVGSVIRDVISTTQDVARERGVTVELEASCPTKVACSAGVLTSMISNLVDNAVKYIGDASTKRVTVRAKTNRGMTRVEVGDTGPGVARRSGPRCSIPTCAPQGRMRRASASAWRPFAASQRATEGRLASNRTSLPEASSGSRFRTYPKRRQTAHRRRVTWRHGERAGEQHATADRDRRLRSRGRRRRANGVHA